MSNIYGRTTKKYSKKFIENQFKEHEKNIMLQRLKEQKGCETPGCSLLDSSLIFPYNKKIVNAKIIECGDYYQIYYYENTKIIIDPLLEKPQKNKKIIDNDFLFKEENINKPKEIEYKNIMRSKFQLQRIVKANENIFKTFITLTFEENITDVSVANKKFDIWRTNIKKIKNDFLYVCVPEFQKRGAIHYHLLTNLDIEKDPNIIIPQKDRKNCYDVKYWSYGFSSVFPMEDVNVVGYITKYMTKDIDNRLWGKRRYLYSQKLKKPSEYYIDFRNEKDLDIIADLDGRCDIKYENIYYDIFGKKIMFIEYKKKL